MIFLSWQADQGKEGIDTCYLQASCREEAFEYLKKLFPTKHHPKIRLEEVEKVEKNYCWIDARK